MEFAVLHNREKKIQFSVMTGGKREGKTDRPLEKPFNLQRSACDQSPNHGVTAALAIPHHLEREVLTGPAAVMHLSAL